MAQNVHKTFINILTKEGKKEKVEKIYKTLLLNIKKKINKQPENALHDSLELLKTRVGLKTLSRLNSLIVFVNQDKQLKNAIQLFLKNNKQQNWVNEILLLLRENSNSTSLQKKIEFYKTAEKFKYNKKI